MVQKITQLILDAARRQSTVSFPVLYQASGICRNAEKHACYRALEEAAGLIRDFRAANYTSLMARKDTGLPGGGFFDTFRLHRYEEYVSLVGDVWVVDLTFEQRKKLAYAERKRVYSDAQPT